VLRLVTSVLLTMMVRYKLLDFFFFANHIQDIDPLFLEPSLGATTGTERGFGPRCLG
jgi:hypothetical protein